MSDTTRGLTTRTDGEDIAAKLSTRQREALLAAEPDADGVLALGDSLRVGTVCALIDRRLVLDLGRGERASHHLTALGRDVRDALTAGAR